MSDRVLILEGRETLRERLALLLSAQGVAIDVADSAETALDRITRVPVDVAFCAADLPGIDGYDVLAQLLRVRPGLTVILTGHEDPQQAGAGNPLLAEAALRRGAWSVLAHPYDPPDARLALERAMERAHAMRSVARLGDDLLRAVGDRPIVAASDAMIDLLECVDRTAGTGSNVLLTGEHGVEKADVARVLHHQSVRRDAPFVRFDCAAGGSDAIERELFGVVDPKRNGAPARRGALAEAHRGTLFLDEMARLPRSVQGTLLHAIEAEAVRPVGASKADPVDVRIVAASSDDLEGALAAGGLRADLLARVAMVRMHVPPLRERREDLPLLVDHRLRILRNRRGEPIRHVDDETLDRLLAYRWPGNVRELELVLERAALATADGTLLPDSLPGEVASSDAQPSHDHEGDGASEPRAEDLRLKPARQAFEADLIRRALLRTGGNRTHAARLLAISHRSLLYKIRDYGLRD